AGSACAATDSAGAAVAPAAAGGTMDAGLATADDGGAAGAGAPSTGAGLGAEVDVGPGITRSRSAHQIGVLTRTTSTALASRANCGRAQPGRTGRGGDAGREAGAAPCPSNRRSASASAASRAAGRGGGGSGKSAVRSWSVVIRLPVDAPRPRASPTDGRSRGRSALDCRDRSYTSSEGRSNAIGYPPSRAIADAVPAARTSWTNSER